MTDFHHDHVVVYGELAGSLRLAKSARVFVTDTVTGTAVNVTQGARTAAYVDTDSNGRATFTATTANRLRLTNGSTFCDVWPIEVAGPDDATVAGLLGTASATRTAADGRWVQLTAVQPVSRGGTGQTTAPAALAALGGAPLSLTGTYAARPAANTVPAGTIYYCTNIPEQYRSDGTTWTVVGSGGNPVGSADLVATFTTASTTAVDITGLSVTFIAGERPVIATLSGLFWATVAASAHRACIVIGSTVYKNVGGTSDTSSRSYESSVPILGLTPGTSYTVKAQLFLLSGTGSAGTGSSAAGSQTSLRVVTA